MENNDVNSNNRDDGYVDFEYMDHDIHLSGKVRRETMEAVNAVMVISIVVFAIGGIMCGCSTSGGVLYTIGIVLMALGVIGILFIAPFSA